ncbi:hypothetical protein [Burkholderia sp. b13]|uniref:hypothetical protein n=1 Tax=Burkholderia sp. b13 TaxID=1761774 RepID=UPI000963F6DF|nr:hypothetical protein [Burkholderia sp. b13]SIT81624.1 hypothetical protein SAMN04487768_0695 [Burkholderia sp. b13]
MQFIIFNLPADLSEEALRDRLARSVHGLSRLFVTMSNALAPSSKSPPWRWPRVRWR